MTPMARNVNATQPMGHACRESEIPSLFGQVQNYDELLHAIKGNGTYPSGSHLISRNLTTYYRRYCRGIETRRTFESPSDSL